MYSHHRNGHAWYSGAVSQWPNHYLRAMEILGDEVSRLEQAQAEQRRRMTAR